MSSKIVPECKNLCEVLITFLKNISVAIDLCDAMLDGKHRNYAVCMKLLHTVVQQCQIISHQGMYYGMNNPFVAGNFFNDDRPLLYLPDTMSQEEVRQIQNFFKLLQPKIKHLATLAKDGANVVQTQFQDIGKTYIANVCDEAFKNNGLIPFFDNMFKKSVAKFAICTVKANTQLPLAKKVDVGASTKLCLMYVCLTDINQYLLDIERYQCYAKPVVVLNNILNFNRWPRAPNGVSTGICKTQHDVFVNVYLLNGATGERDVVWCPVLNEVYIDDFNY